MSDTEATFGTLIVGIGGNNGVTLIAGVLANQRGLEWESATGKVKANYNGCITQLSSKRKKDKFRDRYNLAHANCGVIAGWDVRSTPLGDALYASHVLDYDLVRQVRDSMNRDYIIMPGIWNPSFYGESQHATATHARHTKNQQDSLDQLRDDIRSFKSRNRIKGHTTVIWSASVERPCIREFHRAADLLSAIRKDDPEISPSILYATAACLEGCSFVNGGSQNTLCPGLAELGRQSRAYVLGTDFKAGQTKFKTAAVEYIRALGLVPKVMASSNHLGNNDMLNLTSRKTLDAKMRVKKDIFEGWDEDIDHQVRVMYTPFIGDEKRDVVEYTSLGFLSAPHTMLTYTRCMDSILCVPLMIDVAVWCDCFIRRGVSAEAAAQATAYLFKVPEGAAKGVDPGFFHQMSMLEKVLEMSVEKDVTCQPPGHTAATPLLGPIVCAGISCLDLMLIGAKETQSFDTITTFSKQVFCPGGAAPQTALALAAMALPQVDLLTKIGADIHGEELVKQLQNAGVQTLLTIVSQEHSTNLAILPISQTGRRGCFVNLLATESFTPAEALTALKARSAQDSFAALHFGYPHLMKHFRGEDLKDFFRDVLEQAVPEGEAAPLISVDVNGVDELNNQQNVLSPSLPLVDLLHLNREEAALITGVPLNKQDVSQAATALLKQGVGMVAITLGEAGAYVAVSSNRERFKPRSCFGHQALHWTGQEVLLPAFDLTPGTQVNTNGAGDAFTGGLITALLSRQCLTLRQAVRLALLVARERVDTSRRDNTKKATYAELLGQAVTDT